MSFIKANKKDLLSLRIYHAIRTFQKRNRFLKSAQDTNLSLLNSHLLVELENNPDLSLNELAIILKVNKSSISRSLRSLEKKGIIHIHKNPFDKRKFNLAITHTGKAIIQLADELADKRLVSFETDLLVKKMSNLSGYLIKMSAVFGVPPISYSRSEHPLRPGIRAITRAFGLHSDDIFHSKISVLQWHIYYEIMSSRDKISPSELAEVLILNRNTISSILSRLTKIKHVEKTESAVDSRYSELQLTKTGKQSVKKLEKHAQKLINNALIYFGLAEAEEFVFLLEELAGIKSDLS